MADDVAECGIHLLKLSDITLPVLFIQVCIGRVFFRHGGGYPVNDKNRVFRGCPDMFVDIVAMTCMALFHAGDGFFLDSLDDILCHGLGSILDSSRYLSYGILFGNI